MSRARRIFSDRWLGSLSLIAVGLFLVVINRSGGGGWTSTVLMVGFLVGAAWWSLPTRRGPHRSHVEAQAAAGDDDVIIYWRPG